MLDNDLKFKLQSLINSADANHIKLNSAIEQYNILVSNAWSDLQDKLKLCKYTADEIESFLQNACASLQLQLDAVALACKHEYDEKKEHLRYLVDVYSEVRIPEVILYDTNGEEIITAPTILKVGPNVVDFLKELPKE